MTVLTTLQYSIAYIIYHSQVRLCAWGEMGEGEGVQGMENSL